MLYDSFIEWTCPESGLYYVLVHEYGRDSGTFGLAITGATSLGMGGAGGGDPCSGGATMTEDNAIIDFEPEGAYEHDQRCTWHIECPRGHPELQMQAMATEEGYDYVDIFDGADVHGTELGELSGTLAELTTTTWTGSGTDMFIEFASDESIADRGFRASYICHQ